MQTGDNVPNSVDMSMYEETRIEVLVNMTTDDADIILVM